MILKACFSFCLLLNFFWLPQAIADDFSPTTNTSRPTLQEQFDKIDNALLLELVKLAKFNIRFHLAANSHNKWRYLSYPLGRESGTALTFAATLIELKQLTRGLNNPARISRNELKKAARCGITGNAISGSASALELAQNSWVMFQATKKGYSPASSLAFVKEIVSNTDRLLEAREQLAKEEMSDERRKVTNLETRLVRKIRQQLLFQFATWSCHSRDLAWRENTFYAIDSLQSFTRMSAAIMALKAFKRPKLSRTAIVCALTANSVATLNPIIRNYAGIAIRKHQEHKLAREIPHERPPVPTTEELDQLHQKLSQVTNKDWLQKVSFLTYRTERLDAELNRETNEIERYRQIAQQQSISGPLIGLTGVASSTLGTIAIYGYRADLVTANRLGFAGRITQGTGQAYALINTPYTILHGIIRNRKLQKRGELPSQILLERLARLDKY